MFQSQRILFSRLLLQFYGGSLLEDVDGRVILAIHAGYDHGGGKRWKLSGLNNIVLDDTIFLLICERIVLHLDLLELFLKMIFLFLNLNKIPGQHLHFLVKQIVLLDHKLVQLCYFLPHSSDFQLSHLNDLAQFVHDVNELDDKLC